MLQLDSIDVYYGKIQTLKGVSLTVNDGELVTLIGSNDMGKSTTLRTISGLLRPQGGCIVYDSKRIDRMPSHEIVRQGIVHCPEGRHLFGHLSVTEKLRLGAVPRPNRVDMERAQREVYDLLPILEERGNQSASTLSDGEQQILTIGRALMAQPRLLMLDEPSLGLAPLLVESVFDIIRAIKARGATILPVEQNAWQTLENADRGYVMETGKIILADAAVALRANPQVEQAYLGEAL